MALASLLSPEGCLCRTLALRAALHHAPRPRPRTWIVTSTPLGYQLALVALGGWPSPLPSGHHPHVVVAQHAPPLPKPGEPLSVPHQRTGFAEVPPPPLKATAFAALGRVLMSAFTLSHMSPQPPSSL